MIIRLTEKEYMQNGYEIQDCLRGEMCSIARETNDITGDTRYLIMTDLESGGWAANLDPHDRKFHGWRGTTNNWRRVALGTFVLLEFKEQKNGKYYLRFTGDLNPELP